MKIEAVVSYLESLAPPYLQESYDNAGLLCGDDQLEVSGALVTLDCTEEVIDEAIALNCNLIVAHHPVIFKGLKKLTGSNAVERVLMKAIRNNIALFASHTNLDHVSHGVNAELARVLGLKNTRILDAKRHLLRKLVTFCPMSHGEGVRSALFAAGGGSIGNYQECSFSTEGIGTFKGNGESTPFVGKPGTLHRESEVRIEVIYPIYKEGALIAALHAAHPYEEVAYDLIALENKWGLMGAGMVGELEVEMDELDFLKGVKERLNSGCIRHTPLLGKMVKKVAICGGAGSFLLPQAIASGATVFITGDFKYHEFFSAENKLVIADVGHYESEQFTKDLFYRFITEKFRTFAVHLSKINTNPIKYL